MRSSLTPGQTADITQAAPLLDEVEPDAFIGDKGYELDALVEKLEQRGITPVIPPKANRKEPRETDFALYCERNLVERFFNALKQYRGSRSKPSKASMPCLPSNATSTASRRGSAGAFATSTAIRLPRPSPIASTAGAASSVSSMMAACACPTMLPSERSAARHRTPRRLSRPGVTNVLAWDRNRILNRISELTYALQPVSQDRSAKFVLHLINDVCPVPNLLLPEQPCARVPRTIVPIQQPSPIGIEGQ